MTPGKEEPEMLLNLPQVAKRLKLSATWIKEQADERKIPHLIAGKRLLFNYEAVLGCLLERAASIPGDKEEA